MKLLLLIPLTGFVLLAGCAAPVLREMPEAGLLSAIAGSVQRTFGRSIQVVTSDEASQWLMPEAESIAAIQRWHEAVKRTLHCES